MRIASLSVALIAFSPLVAAQASTAEASWNQPRGNAAGTAALAMAGLHAQPVEEWRQPIGELLCEPVVSGGVIYAAARKENERRLHAFRCRGGEALGSCKLGRGGAVELAVWGGIVVVVEEKELESFSHRAGAFKSVKRLTLDRPLGSPCVHEGRLLIGDGRELYCVEIQNLKLLARAPGGGGRPAVLVQEKRAIVTTFSIEPEEGQPHEVLNLHMATLEGTGKVPTLRELQKRALGAAASETERRPGHVIALGLQGSEVLWYVHSSRPLLSQQGGMLQACLSSKRLAPITSDAAVVEGAVFGFDDEGTLIRFQADGFYGKVVVQADFPPGARPGAVTAAADVLYLGNWAVEIESGRVLWCLAELEASTPIVPTEDGRIAVGSAQGELVGYLDPNRAGASAGGTAEAAPANLRPDADGAVILADGRVLPGPLRRAENGAFSVPGEGDEPRSLEAREVAYARTESGERIGREQYPVYLAWRAALEAELASALETLAAGFARDRHVADARRLLQEALEYGLPPARQRALEDTLAGKPENKEVNAAAKLKKKRAEEQGRREQIVATYLAASAWCAERDLDAAGTGLLARARRILPTAPSSIRERAWTLLPPEFPHPESEDAPKRWLDWAEELLPAEAVFVARDERAWQGLPEDWRERAIGLRTKNLLLFSMSSDPAVIGPCLRKGEGTLRALDDLFPEVGATGRALETLQVRIFADRASFLAGSAEAGHHVGRSAGYYSPAENLSRFYVPRDEEKAPLQRELASVLAHELTHHYLEQRWQPLRSGGLQSGFWVVEGFASFMQEQLLELGRASRGFEDATVMSLDVASQALKKGIALPLKLLIDLPYSSFESLGDAPLGELELRYTLGRMAVSEQHLFHEQAGSLAFFLMNRCGEKGRAALLEYMKDYHLGKTKPEGWKALGWESAEVLEDELHAFLRTVSG